MIKTATLRLMLIAFFFGALYAQFPGPAGTPGSTAIHKDSSVFVNWATTCLVTRGYMDIANPSGGFASFGADSNGTKKAGLNGVVSLGDGGQAILTFPHPIRNGPGPDFAVFENAFNDTFLELAFVEVSSDGINFFRFPSASNTQTITQIGPFDSSGDATKIHNLAGKYRVNYGTPFDLQDLANTPGLDVNNITHIRIIDVVGCIQPPYASFDSQNKIINDPYPTDYSSGGFDLDAVGVIHENVQSSSEHFINLNILVYPQPVDKTLFISIPDKLIIEKLFLFDINGIPCIQSNGFSEYIDVSEIPEGIYFLIIQTSDKLLKKKVLIKR
jgi:hypothetical protein